VDDLATPEDQEKQLPRWVQVPAGIAFGLGAVIATLGSLTMMLVPNDQSPILYKVAGAFVMIGSIWVMDKSLRLVMGRKKQRGLMSPNTLRLLSWCLLALPIAGIFTGFYEEMPVFAIFQAVMYFLGFKRLQTLASKREVRDL
jgi:hypothetical protein